MTSTAVAQIPEATNKVAFKADIERWTPQLASFCRHGFTPDRLIAGALQAAVNTPDLFACQPASIFLALVKCARLGLDIGESGMWLVPIDSKGVKRCEAWIDYRGYKVLGQRARLIRSMEEYVVYQGDEFDYALGLNPYLTHKPTSDPKARGPIIGAYAIIERPHQPKSFHFLPIADIEARRAKSRGWNDKALAKKGEPTGPIAWWCKKAVCRDWFSRQPKTGDLVLALAADDEAPDEAFDPETGETLASMTAPKQIAPARANASASASPEQLDLLARMYRSHVWRDEERAAIEQQILAGLSREAAGQLIDEAAETIKARKAAEKASQAIEAGDAAEGDGEMPF